MRSGLIALALLATPARAGDETQQFAPGMEARVWSPWPACVHKGWAPIFLELRNDLASEREVEVEAQCGDWGSERRVRTSLRLAPKSSAELELLVPMGGMFMNQYVVQLHSDDDSAYFGEAVGSNSTNPTFHPVLLLSERTPEAGAVERWSERLSSATIAESPRFIVSAGGVPTATTGGSPTPNDVQVARAPFAGMPRHHGAYSSLDLVVLDPADGMPSEAQLAPLVAWVRTGGELLVVGESARAEALAVPELAAWMEPRFETPRDSGREYRCGLGRLFVGEVDGELADSAYVDWTREILGENAGLTPKIGKWRGDKLTLSIPGLARLPYRTIAGLLILFALVIGPVNFLVVRKRRSPVLLLLTIPALALVTTLALLAYGIFFQGVDVKSASYSVAVLDQREHRSACVEAREFFAGLAPAAGLALGPGTVVHAWPLDGSRLSNRRRLEVELGDGPLLAGDYLPSRKATSQVLAVERAERARLDVRRNGDALEIANNLGVEVEALLVRDPEGAFYALEGRLAPGASVELGVSPGPRAVGAALEPALRSHLSLTPYADDSSYAVPPGCYLARLAASPFRDDCGIETNELAGEHVVLGVLPLEPEAWR